MEQEQKVDPTDAKLRELINWMLDSYTIREMLKNLIADREKKDEDWLAKNLGKTKDGF